VALNTPLWLSASACGLVALEAAVAACVEAGCRHVELAIGPRWTPATRHALRSHARDGVCFSGHHAFSLGGRDKPFDLCDRWCADDCEVRLDQLAEIGASRYSVHAGSHVRGDGEAGFARFVERFSTLRAMAASRGIEVGIETMYPLRHGDRRYLADDLCSTRALARALPGVRWVLDLAHVGLWGRAARVEALAALRALPLLEVHVSDNDGRSDTHTAIRDDTWWVGCAELPVAEVPWVMESRMGRAEVASIRTTLRHVADLLASHPRALTLTHATCGRAPT
jgi:sugar phosphate isomerase/epimerase